MDLENRQIDIVEIMDKIPHRYPMLLVDRIIEINEEGCIGRKCVTMNEEIFQGHFPGAPIFPGVLTVEAMAQTASVYVMTLLEAEGEQDNLVCFMSIDKVKFRKPITPGDTMEFHITKVAQKGPVWSFKGVAKVDGKVASQAEFKAMITPRNK